MNNILNITGRLKDKRRRDQLEAQKDRIETVVRTVQCSACNLKCAMCGYHLDHSDSECPDVSSVADFALCEHCRLEFQDFLDATNGNRMSDCFWHNEEWVSLWSAWLDFREAVRSFKNTPEFKKMLEDY